MKVKILVILALMVVLATTWYFTPKRYSTTLDGVYYQLGEEGIIEDVKIQLNGKLRNHINGIKSFNGVVDIEGEKVPQLTKDRSKLELHYPGGNFGSILSPFRAKDDRGAIAADVYYYGTVYINNDFTKFTITVSNDKNKQWTPTNGFMITAPASDREEAITISQELMRKFGIVINH
ncbi:hypothetical protein ACFRAM_10890 [Paenibacillus sp. NPDC056722]|uniref:hypothetical protein n=1 Tax=Paenibacillus sp. NPDC056722 TaxID=3345924 RepID=UPI0036BB32C0